MTNTNPEKPFDSAAKVDSERLSALVEQANALRDKGEVDYLSQVLSELDDVERSLYARSLTQHLGETVQLTLESSAPSAEESIDKDFSDAEQDQPHGTIASSVRAPSSQPRPGSSSRSQSPAQDDRPTTPIPEKIGKFLIKKELGRGAFGVVYLGYDEELQRNVAVKLSLVSDPKLQERLRIEASKLAQAESPGIVPVYHIGRTDDDNVYIVQKFIEGSTLRAVLRDHPLSPVTAVALIREIAIGLGPAHAIDILHRDLKPDNILIEASGKAWIADFGLAISEDEQLDQKRELAGTPPYMSPEQILGRIDFLDPRSDIWALGVMFYESLTGKLPFNGKERVQLAMQICELDPRPLHQRAPGILTESMNEVFLKCCAKKPADRYTTVHEFVDALDQLAWEGLSDQNILGQATPVIGVLPAGPGAATRGASFDTTRRFTTRTQRHGQTTRSSARLSSKAIPTQRTLHTAVWVLAGVALCLSALGIFGYQLRSQRSKVDASKEVVEGAASPALSALNASGPGAADPTSLAAAMTKSPSEGQLRLGDGSKEKPWVVAPGEQGTHTTVAAAVAGASPGDFIRVTPGLYRESLLITKPLTIEGQPPKSGVYPCVIENDQQSPVTIDCADGQVKLRSFMISGKGHRLTNEFNPIELIGGQLHLESCALETRSQNCVKVRGQAQLSVLACKFNDSSEFAISAKDFSQISIVGSDFISDGIEVTGGTGTVESCKFFGDAGIYVANNLKPVEAVNCLFENNGSHSLLATDGGNLNVTSASIRGSKTGIGVTDKPMTADSPIVGRPGTVRLVQTKLEQCEVGLQIDGGTLVATDECFIDGGLIAIGISTGKVDLTGVSITRINEKAIVIYQGGEATLRKCNLSSCEQTAIKITHGSLTLEGGSIEDFMLYGVMMGEQKMTDRKDIQVRLEEVTLRSPMSEVAGVIAFSGRLELRSVVFDGARYGLFLDGRAFVDADDKPAVAVTAAETRFKNQSGFGMVALGRAQLMMDKPTHASLNATKGVKVSEPAQVVVDERGQ